MICVGCKWAKWKVTDGGKLHPSGDGQCQYPYQIPDLPGAMYWIGKFPPSPCGGRINRREPLNRHCPYYQKEKK